jgi:farnesyl diphosphate synthase
MTPEFSDRLAAAAPLIDDRLARALPGNSEQPLHAAMRYALRGGKRLRGFLVIEGARLFDIDPTTAAWAAAAIEAIHAYSLVHDDLPAMDDDDLRRGQPTVHVKWDDATAILVGDALQSLAFELIGTCPDIADATKVELISGLARASGAAGMVMGQALDIAAEQADAPLDLDATTNLQRLKTGALINWSCTAGPIMAGADPKPLIVYGRALGLAFQIADDILDATGDQATTGKRVGKDADAGKATFVSLMGIDGAKARARDLVDQAMTALDDYGPSAGALRECAQFIVSRDH